ncbi:uncharacterized protein [Branchiostoma lanceolatum]|uniref:uncharacterized protein n=1 Tax=Branchiostoma lanceolatum TaxID=7740 RepID=UPI0034545DBA
MHSNANYPLYCSTADIASSWESSKCIVNVAPASLRAILTSALKTSRIPKYAQCASRHRLQTTCLMDDSSNEGPFEKRHYDDAVRANDGLLQNHSLHQCLEGDLEAISPEPASLRLQTDTDGITLELNSLQAIRPPSDVFVATRWKPKCCRKLVEKMTPSWIYRSVQLQKYGRDVPGAFLCQSLCGTNILLCASLRWDADSQAASDFYDELGSSTLGNWLSQRAESLLKRTWDELRRLAPTSNTLLHNLARQKLNTGIPLRVYKADWLQFAMAFDSALAQLTAGDGEMCPFAVRIVLECFGQKMPHNTANDAAQLDEVNATPNVNPLKTLADLRIRKEFVGTSALHIGVSVGLQDRAVSTLWHRNLRVSLFNQNWQKYNVMGMDDVINITTRKDRKPAAALSRAMTTDTFDLTYAQAYNPLSSKMSSGWTKSLTNGLPVTLAAASGLALHKATKSTHDFVQTALDGTVQASLEEITMDLNPATYARFEVVLTCDGEDLSSEAATEQVKYLVATLRRELSGPIPVIIPVHSTVLHRFAHRTLTDLTKPIHAANVDTTQGHSRLEVTTIAISEVLFRLLLVGRVDGRESAYLHGLGIRPDSPWNGFTTVAEPSDTTGWTVKKGLVDTWAREGVLCAPPWRLLSANDNGMFCRMHRTLSVILTTCEDHPERGSDLAAAFAEIYWTHVRTELTQIMLSRNMRALLPIDGIDALFHGTLEGRGVRVTGKIDVAKVTDMLCDVAPANLPTFCSFEAVVDAISRQGISAESLRHQMLELLRQDRELTTFPYVDVKKGGLKAVRAGFLLRVQGGEHVYRDICIRANAIVSGDFGARLKRESLDPSKSWVTQVLQRIETVSNENTTLTTNCIAFVYAVLLHKRGFKLNVAAIKKFRCNRHIPVMKLQEANVLGRGMSGRLNEAHQDIVRLTNIPDRRRMVNGSLSTSPSDDESDRRCRAKPPKRRFPLSDESEDTARAGL